jgi:hypothetical protein
MNNGKDNKHLLQQLCNSVNDYPYTFTQLLILNVSYESRLKTMKTIKTHNANLNRMKIHTIHVQPFNTVKVIVFSPCWQ